MSNYEYAQATDDQLADWAIAAYEDDEWEQSQAQILWAEAGGYKAGLPRPAYYGR